jgi:hypothetical protein
MLNHPSSILSPLSLSLSLSLNSVFRPELASRRLEVERHVQKLIPLLLAGTIKTWANLSAKRWSIQKYLRTEYWKNIREYEDTLCKCEGGGKRKWFRILFSGICGAEHVTTLINKRVTMRPLKYSHFKKLITFWKQMQCLFPEDDGLFSKTIAIIVLAVYKGKRLLLSTRK